MNIEVVEGGLAAMKLICMHCKKTLRIVHQDELSTLLYSDAGVYFFCSKKCKDQWAFPIAPKKDFDKLRQTSM
jgi:YHS domain-containing protein